MAAGKFHGDEHADPDRLPGDEDAVLAARRRLDAAEDADRLLRVPAEELCGVGHLAAGIRHRLAVLDDDQPGQVVGALGEQVEGAAEDLGALPRGGGRPAGQRRLGDLDRP
jgi:hypothetical protein